MAEKQPPSQTTAMPAADNKQMGSSMPPAYGGPPSQPASPGPQFSQQQQQPTANPASGYPGVVGGTPANQRGVQGYDAYGNPIIPPFIAQRHQIEQSLGPTCNGQYHELRMEYTNKTLLFAILILPYCCGWRGKRVCTCKNCRQKFPNIVLPEP